MLLSKIGSKFINEYKSLDGLDGKDHYNAMLCFYCEDLGIENDPHGLNLDVVRTYLHEELNDLLECLIDNFLKAHGLEDNTEGDLFRIAWEYLEEHDVVDVSELLEELKQCPAI